MIPLDVAAIVTASHTPVVRIEAWKDGVLADAQFQRHVTSADLSAGIGRWPRHALSMTLGGLELAPTGPDSLLAPGSTEFRVFLGVLDGVRVLEAQAASVWLDSSRVVRSQGAVVEVVAYSLEARVEQAGFWDGDLQPQPGETCAALIKRLIRHGLADAPEFITNAGNSTPVPADLGLSGSLWGAVEDVARIGHLEVGVDRLGRVVIGEMPVMAAAPDYVLATGPGGTIIETESTLERQGSANAARVVYRSTTPGAADVVGVYRQPSGPMAWDGPAGRLLYTDTRDGPVTQAEADAAARDALGQRLGYIRKVGLAASPDPRVEPGDTVEVRLASGGRERHLVTGVQRQLAPPGPMNLWTRGDFLAGTP